VKTFQVLVVESLLKFLPKMDFFAYNSQNKKEILIWQIFLP